MLTLEQLYLLYDYSELVLSNALNSNAPITDLIRLRHWRNTILQTIIEYYEAQASVNEFKKAA